jgi:lipoprotein NlpI
MPRVYSFVFTGVRTFLLLGSLIYSCAATLPPATKPPENYQGVIVESPLHQPEDYWIYQKADGSTLKTRARSYPMTIDFPLWLGRTWSYSRDSLPRMYTGPSNANRIPVETTCEVTAFRPITVPAGSFDAVECNCNCRVPARGHFESECGRYTFWYAPAVKNIIQARGESTATALDLVEYKVGDTTSTSTAIQDAKPKDADEFNTRGNDYRTAGENDRAIESYSEAIRLNPSHSAAFNGRGAAYRSKGDYDRAIADYDEALKLNPRNHEAFNNRGNAYRIKENYDRAIQDYNEAIRLNPNYPLAFSNRSLAYRSKGDYDRAIQDNDKALRLNPAFVLAYRNRGGVRFEQGNLAAAAQDFAKAAELDPSNLYNPLWLYLVETRAGQRSQPGLESRAQRLNLGKWPGAVVAFYLGKIDEKAMYAAAENPEPKKKTEQICEANFFAAEAKLFKGETTEAIPLLRAAERDCPPTFYEAHGARAELKRLGY